MGVADLPVEALKALGIHPDAHKSKSKSKSKTSTKDTARPPRGDSEGPTTALAHSAASAASPSTVTQNHGSHDSVGPVDPAARPTVGQPYNVHEALASMSSAATAPSSDSNKPRKSEPLNAQNIQEAISTSFSLEAAMGTTLSAARIAGAGIKSPMDFTSSLARGFHNAPRLYGDTSVRPSDKITDLSSGLRAAGRELQYGLSDGISGLVTQPLEGARSEGVAGFFKGFARGIGGVVFKPAAAFWGIPGHTSRGIYKELRKRFGPSVENYIVASRTAQGFAELAKSDARAQEAVVDAWLRVTDGGKATAADAKRRAGLSGSTGTRDELGSVPVEHDEEMEEAIRRSVVETSRGSAEEDAEVERAMRTSVADLEAKKRAGADDDEMQAAMAASIAEAQIGPDHARQDEAGAKSAASARVAEVKGESDDQAEMSAAELAREEEVVMRYVMRQSLAEEEARQAREGTGGK